MLRIFSCVSKFLIKFYSIQLHAHCTSMIKFMYFQVLIGLLLSFLIVAIESSSGLMISSMIAESLVQDPKVTREDVQGLGKLASVMKCVQSSWCFSVCILTDSKIVLTSLEVSGGISINGEITCFTPRRRVIFPSESASMTGMPESESQKKLSNLNTGAYNLDINSCYFVRSTMYLSLIHI